MQYKIVLNHRPFICLRDNTNKIDDDECWLNMWKFKEFEDIMNDAGLDIMLAGHEH